MRHRVPYKFTGRTGDRYYWSRPAPEFAPGFEEVVWCSVDWFWGKR